MLIINFIKFISTVFLHFFYIFYFFFKLGNLKVTNKNINSLKFKFFKEIFIYNFFKFVFNYWIFLFFYFFIVSKTKLKNFSFFYFNKFKKISMIKYNSIIFNFFNFFNFLFIFAFFVILYILISFTIETIPFAKIWFFWGSIGAFGYIFISGFIYFGKRYNYTKYTEALQRFWKRSFSIFWLLEGFIFAIFIYVTLNSSSEVAYSFDPQVFFKLHFFSWKIFIFKLIFIKLILVFLYIIFLNLKKNSINFFFFFLISALVIYLFFIEFCQFFQFLNHANYFSWNYNSANYEYSLDSDLKRTRTMNNYVLICCIAKFWHIIFIFFVWFFNFNRFFESNDARAYILATNLQNFLILYLLNWICMYPWFKAAFRYYLNTNYFWFFSEFKENFFLNFLSSSFLLYKSFF
jgi:hypothetical protein